MSTAVLVPDWYNNKRIDRQSQFGVRALDFRYEDCPDFPGFLANQIEE
jgi:hypothetical protein